MVFSWHPIILHHNQPIHEGRIYPTTSAFSNTKCLWFHEFVVWQCESNISDVYFCGIQSSYIITNQSMKTEHIPRQVHFSRNIVRAFVQFGVSQQQSNISDWLFRGTQSSYIITSRTMNTEHIPRQLPLHHQVFVLLCNWVYLNRLSGFSGCLFSAINQSMFS